MERNIKRFWDQFNILVWFIVVVEAFIFCLAIIHGHACGYKNSLIAHGILGLLVVGLSRYTENPMPPNRPSGTVRSSGSSNCDKPHLPDISFLKNVHPLHAV
jgi:hypothetical protein